MENITTLEQFLSLTEIKRALKLTEFRNLSKLEDKESDKVLNAQKSKLVTTLELSRIVNDGYEWFKGEEGKRLLKVANLSLNTEQFALKVYGYQRSYFYKLIKASKLTADTLNDYEAKCTELGTKSRTLEELLKFAKNPDTYGNEGEGEGEGEDKENDKNIVTFATSNGDKIAFRITSKGILKSNNTKEQILAKLSEVMALIEQANG